MALPLPQGDSGFLFVIDSLSKVPSLNLSEKREGEGEGAGERISALNSPSQIKFTVKVQRNRSSQTALKTVQYFHIFNCWAQM